MHQRCQDVAALRQLLETLVRSKRPHALLTCNFRQFNRVLAIYGSEAAEQLMAAARARLTVACPADAICIRLQPSELVIVLPQPGDSQELLKLAEQCTQHCRPMEHSPAGVPLRLNVAIGAALAETTDACSSQELINRALLARIEAEQHPGSTVVLAPSQIQQLAQERYQLESDLHVALERDELTTHLQPIVNLRDGSTIGFECLARWPGGAGALTSPASFMAMANACDIAADIDLQVLRLALQAAPELAAANSHRPLILSTNLSGQLIENPQRVLDLLELIRSHRRPDSIQLQLELLEESFNNTAYELDALLEWLSEQKVLIAIDDFGTGYSSLSRLHDLAINTIKVDRSFVQRINAPERSSNHLLQSLIAISKDLQMDLTAEGIDSEEQRQWLLAQGVEHGQGFLFSQPLCLSDAIDYLTS